MMQNFLIEVTPVKPDGTIKTIWMSRRGVSNAGVNLDNKQWLPLLETLPTFSLNLMSSGQLQIPQVSYGDLEFICSDAYANEEWSTYDWSNALATCWWGTDGAPFSEYQQVFAGRVSGFNRTGIYAKVALLGSEADLQRPALYAEYAGTGGVEGGAGIKGNLKPRAHGYCRNVAPVQIDTVYLVYQVHGYGPISGIPKVYDFAQELAPASANVSTYNELIAMDLQPGQWATCNAHGLFRLGGSTDKKLTCDVQGALHNGVYTNTVKTIVQQLIREVQPSATFGTFGAFADAEWCFYSTGAEMVANIAYAAVKDAGGYLIADGMGRWQVGDFYAPVNRGQLRSDRSTLPLIIDHEETSSTGPVWKVTVGHDRCWSVHTPSEISPSIFDADGYVTDEAFQDALDEFNETKAEVEVQLSRLDAIVADGVLDRAEKKYWVQQYAVETADWNKLNSDAAQWDVSSQLYLYNVRFNDLNSYLNSLSPAWNDGSQDTPVDRAGYRAAWEGLYSAKIALTQAMAESAKWEKINGPGKPEDNATVGAPSGTPVGDKTADEVVDAITDDNGVIIPSKTLHDRIEEAQETAENLKATYGDTVSAAAAANSAAAHEQIAAAAAANAQGALSDAQAARDVAAGKAQDSEAARAAAVAAQTASELARGQSQGFAGNSEASRAASDAAKTVSEQARDQAQQFASNSYGSQQAAAGSASTATTKAGEAGHSATAAQASAVTAKATVAALLPTDFSEGWTYWAAEWSTGQGAPLPEWSLVDTSSGRVARLTNYNGYMRDLANVGRIPVVAGRKIRITVKWRVIDSAGVDPEIELFRIGIPTSGGQFNNAATQGHIAVNAPGWGDNNGWATATYNINTDDFINVDPRSAYMRVLIRMSRPGVYDVLSVRVDDVTSEQAAKSSAEAAASSQSAASISEGKAGQSASAAELSRTNASTHEGGAWQHREAANQYRSDAETFRNQASQSETNASGSAATATQQAGLAAGSANQAGQSAGAAAGSASTATSKAGEASQSASAAQASSVSASTAAQAMMPSTFGDINNWTSDWGNANGVLDGRFNAYDHGTYGRILDVYNSPHFSPHIVPKGRISLVRDKVYRITVKWALTGYQLGTPVNATIFAIGIRPNSAQTGDYWNSNNVSVSISEGQIGWGSFWATHTLEVHSNGLIDNGCQWTRPLFRLDSQGHFAVQTIEIRDITGEYHAAGSANAAAGSESAAAIYKGQAEQSASAANTSRTNAATSEGNAWDHRVVTDQLKSQAETFRNEASQSKTDAAGSASTATQQANLAAGSANQAGGSASAAAGSASGAASSASQAGQSASAAQQAEVSATTRAQAMMPSTFLNMKDWTWDYRTGTSDLSGDNRWWAYDHGTLGSIVQLQNNPHISPHTAPKGRVALIRDHVYRITVKWALFGQQNGDVPQNAAIFAIGIRPDQSDWNDVNMGVSVSPGQAGWGSGGWATHYIDVHSNTLLDQGCAWVRPLFRIDSPGVFGIQSIEIRDITGEYNAAGSANAAAGSASTASIKASEAGQSASSANTSQTNASTNEYNSWLNRQAAGAHEGAAWDHRQGAAGHESAAQTYRNEASQSRSDAAGSASTASQQAGLASTSASQAGGSAQAAAGSASTASSKASEAQQSASAASSSQVTASNAATGAQQQFANTFPNFVGPVGKAGYDYMGDNGNGFSWENGPDQNWPQPYITAQAGGQGGQYNRIGFKQSVDKVVGRRYRVTGWFYTHGNNCQIVSLWLLTTNNNQWDGNASSRGSDNTPPGCVNNIAINSPGFNKFGIEFTVDGSWPSKWKPIFEFQTTGGTPNGLWHMTGLTIEDITSEKAAADSASAASSSYSNALYEAGLAGQRAEAASGSANTANIRAGDAAGSANAAAGSAAQASGSASAASTSAITAASFSTGGGNLIPETTFATSSVGWNFYSPFDNNWFAFSRDQSGDDWRPTNEHNIGINQRNNDGGAWSQWHSDQISVTGSTWYEFSAYTGAHRCNAYIRVDWLDANGSGITSNYTNTNAASAQGGRDINAWYRNWGKVQSPWNAARAHVVFVKDPTLGGYSDSYAWFCRPMLRQSNELANGPSPYSPGSGALTAVSQQASITQTALALATATDQLASLKTIVQSGSPNLLRNGGFNSGMSNWGQTHGGWNPHVSGGWGQVANRGGDWEGNHTYIESAKLPIFGGATYTLAADSLYYLHWGDGHCYTEIVWFDGAGNWITQNSGTVNYANHDYSNSDVNRNIHRLTAVAPGNATHCVARLVHYKGNASVNAIGWRQVKLEQNNQMTAYSNEASVTTLAESVTQLNGKTAAYWQVESVAGSGRAQLRVVADSNGGGGVDIVGDLRVTGNALISGTVNPEALALDRFVKRISGSGGGNPNAGQSLLLYAQDIGVTSAHGSYLIELNGSMTTTVGRNTTTVNNKPFYTNHNPDGGLLVRIVKNGSTIYESRFRNSR
ncbi:hypothetical protein [Sphingobium limneticum]|nr:hypothetical protein [Sphingobium limneticum]